MAMMVVGRSGMWGARVCACACVPLAAGLWQHQHQREQDENERLRPSQQAHVLREKGGLRQAGGTAVVVKSAGTKCASLALGQQDTIMERVERTTRVSQFTQALKQKMVEVARHAESAISTATASTVSRVDAVVSVLAHVQTQAANAAHAQGPAAGKHFRQGAGATTDRVYDDSSGGTNGSPPPSANGDNGDDGQNNDPDATIDADTDMPLHVAHLIQSAHHAVDQQDFKKAAALYDKALAAAEEAPLHETQLAALATVAGNAHLLLRHYRRAIELFTPAIRVILKQANYQPDARAIELSMKVASCYHSAGEARKAESGYRWCMDQAKQLKDNRPNDKEAQSLHGLVLEEFGMFLGAQKQLRDARTHFLLAADCAQELQEPVISAATRCYIYASKCSLDLGDVDQASMDLARAQELCASGDCLFHKEVKEQAKRIQQQRHEDAH